MQQPKIFLVDDDAAALLPMEESRYDAENILQDHLSQSPDLLPGDQINQGDPRRWLLVKQEAGIPAAQDGADHWSLDHIFVDQDGIPTFVECKRSSDPRLRREVVAQMLDYAANGSAYWPQGELRRLVEFLNAQMQTVEVLAIELKQFVNHPRGLKAFVPRVIGQTAALQAKKKYASISSQLASYPQRALFEDIVQLARRHGHSVEPGITNFSLKYPFEERLLTYAFGKPTPAVQFYSEYLLAGHQEIVREVEQALAALGYGYSGKYTITIPLENNAEKVLSALDSVMSILDNS